MLIPALSFQAIGGYQRAPVKKIARINIGERGVVAVVVRVSISTAAEASMTPSVVVRAAQLIGRADRKVNRRQGVEVGQPSLESSRDLVLGEAVRDDVDDQVAREVTC